MKNKDCAKFGSKQGVFMRDMQLWNQAFSQDVTSAILVLQTMKRLQGSCVEHFSYVITFFCTNKLA